MNFNFFKELNTHINLITTPRDKTIYQAYNVPVKEPRNMISNN